MIFNHYNRYIIYDDKLELQEKVNNVIKSFETKNPRLKVILKENFENGFETEFLKGFYTKNSQKYEFSNWSDILPCENSYKKESKLKALIYDQNSKEYLYRIDEVHILNEKNIDLRTFDNDIVSDITISYVPEVKTYAVESKGFGSLVTAFCYIELYRKK